MKIKEILKPVIFVFFSLLAVSGVALGACQNITIGDTGSGEIILDGTGVRLFRPKIVRTETISENIHLTSET